jgi:hypothetical protein
VDALPADEPDDDDELHAAAVAASAHAAAIPAGRDTRRKTDFEDWPRIRTSTHS